MAKVPKKNPAGDPSEKYKFEAPQEKESRNTVFILIGIMLVLIVLGVGVLILLFMGRVIPPIGISLPNVIPGVNLSNVTNATCGDDCLFGQAMNLTDPGFCKQISDDKRRNDCYIALSNDSLSACVNVQDNATLEGCVMKFAVQRGQTEVCLYLPEPYATQCMALLDPCYHNNGTARSLCLALEKQDYSQCGGDAECLFNYSVATGKGDACSAISGAANQSGCASAATHKDKCYDLSLQSEKDLCYEIYATRTNDSRLCSAITPDNLYMLACVGYFVGNGADYGTCDVLTLNNRWNCYKNYSLGTGDVSGCVAIDKLASSSRFSCMYEFAKKWGDPSACDLTNDPAQTLTCYVGAIMNNTNLDYTHCQAVAQVAWRNKCYMQSALLRGDASLCDLIATENEKNDCISAVQKQ